MIIKNYEVPKSSFISVEKDLNTIVNCVIKNKNLQKLLYYTVPDALAMAPLTDQQKMELFGKNIKIVPKLYIDGSVLNYIIISFDNFTPNMTNPQFRDNMISFDIICHFDQWHLKDFQLRPYRIAAELDMMINEKHLSGIGTLNFAGANQIILNDEFAGISLNYVAVHGEDDKKFFPNPADQEIFLENFNDIYNK